MTNEQINELLMKIGRAPLLTREEELVLLRCVKEKGLECDEMKRLEQANMRFVVSLVAQYQHRELTLEELIEAGKTGLRNAAESFDIDSDGKFIAYAVSQMRQSIEQAIAEKNSCTHQDY